MELGYFLRLSRKDEQNQEIISKCDSNMKRRSERGNVFFTLFGAVAVVGVLGAGIMSTMRGPLSTMVDVNRIEQAKSEARVALGILLQDAVGNDPDGDGLTEPVNPQSCSDISGNGGCVPSSSGAPKSDPWGNAYKYCAWNNGSDSGSSGNILAGGGTTTNIAVAILSAGPDGTFSNECNNSSGSPAYVPSQSEASGDDIIVAMTYTEAIAGSGGLWTPTTDIASDPAAQIDRHVDLTGSVSGSSLGSAQLRLGAASMLLPSDSVLTTCNSANDNLVRVNTSANPNRIEICDNGYGDWVGAGSVWISNSGDEIYFGTGGSTQVGIGTSSPSYMLEVAGTLHSTGNMTTDGVFTATGNVSGADGIFSGDVSGTNATFTGNVGAVDGNFTGDVSGSDGIFSGDVSGLTLSIGSSGQMGVDTNGDITAPNATLSGDLSAANGSFSGNVDAVNGTLTGTLSVSGTSNLQGNIENSGGDVTVGDNLSVTGTLDVDQDATFDADVIVQSGDSLIPPTTCTSTQKLTWGTNGWSCSNETAGPGGSGVAINLDDLDDVSAGSPSSNECLVYNGSSWASGSCTGGVAAIWEESGSVIRIANSGYYSGTDFVFGSPQLDDDGEATHDGRFFYDKSQEAFRAGAATNAAWDSASIGFRSQAIGTSPTATNTGSIAIGNFIRSSGQNATSFGYDTHASGDYSMAIGLANSWGGSNPEVSGTGSLGIFMGNQRDYNLSVDNRMALVGGDFLIDDVGATGLQGCLRYNGGTSKLEYSDDCSTFTAFTDASGLWTDLTGGRIHYGDTGTEQVGIGTNNPQATLDVNGGIRVGRVTGNAPNYMVLNDLGDVSAASPSDGDCVIYNNTTSAWESGACAGGGKWLDGATVGEIYYNGGNIGAGSVTDPAVAMDIGGTLKVADGGEACAAGLEGAIRYSAGVLQFCDGSSWQNVSAAAGGVTLQFDRVVETDMDINGSTCGAPPCYSSATTFTLSNVGSVASDALTSLSFTGQTSNFDITSNTCTGATLNAGDSCSIVVRATASGNANYSAQMEVAHHNLPRFTVSGAATSFGCAPGVAGWGGVVVVCDYSGPGEHLVTTESGCGSATNEPTCSGNDGLTRQWSLEDVDLNAGSTSNGAQNSVNVLNYARNGQYPAIEHCDALVHNGESDWFLPAPNELVTLYNNKGAVGGVSGSIYWSSRDLGDRGASSVRMSDGTIYVSNTGAYENKQSSHRVRCMRVEGVALPSPSNDTSPNRYRFRTRFASAAGVSTSSNTVTIKGITPGAPISISGDASAEYSINGGGFTNAAGTVDWGDTVQVRMDSPAIGTRVEATVSIGSTNSEYSVITEGDCGGVGCAGVDKRVFVTSGTTRGDLTGVGGPDARCQSQANAASLGGTWEAIITTGSSSSSWAVNRMDYNWDRLVNMNGDVIADDPTDLWNGSIDNSINYTQYGSAITNEFRVLSGSDAYGTYNTNGNCSSWSSTGSSGRLGDPSQTSYRWMDNMTHCNHNARLYCVEVNSPTVTLSATPSSGANMNVTGPGAPATGTEVVFTIENTGTAISAALGVSLTNSTNFSVTTDTCTGNTLAVSATCDVGVTPQASADGNYFGTLSVEDGTNNTQVNIGMSGVSSGFGVAVAQWLNGVDAGDIYYNGGYVGIGNNDPDVALDVVGTLKVANGGETCAAGLEGAIRYNVGVLQFCDGTSWQNISSATGGVVLQFDQITETGMDIDGLTCGAPPCYGTTISFILSNAGTVTSDTLNTFTFTGDTTNFDITSNSCSGATLAAGASCQIDIRPTASGNVRYDARMEVAHHNNPTFDVAGEASGFGCAPGLLDTATYGGVIVACDYGGAGNHLVIDEGGCDGSTNEPVCAGGTAAPSRVWASSPYDALSIGSLTSSTTDGDQNHVNILAYANGDTSMFPAAQYCEDLVLNGKSDWFLPASNELVDALNDTSTLSGGLRYFTSREDSASDRACFVSGGGEVCNSNNGRKYVSNRVRCMRVDGVALPSAQSDNSPDVSMNYGVRFESGFASSAGVSTISSTETVYSITPGTAISITGGGAEYSINGGGYTSAAGTVSSGDTITIRMDSPAVGTREQTNLSIGSETFYYSVITLPDCGGIGCTGIDKRVFFGTGTHSSNVANTTLDADCQSKADTAGLGGTWMAITSSDSPSNWAVNRIDYNWDRLVNMNGDVIATSPQDLWDGTIVNPINYDENGASLANANVRTNSYADGVYRPNGYGHASKVDSGWISVGGSGVLSGLYCMEVTVGAVTFTSTPPSAANMNVIGPGAPSTGTEVVFTIENTGSTATSLLATSLSNSVNFQISTDTCSGNSIAAAATCTVGVTPQSSADGNYFGTLTVADGTNNVNVGVGLSGVASGFGVAVAQWLNGDDSGDIYYNGGAVGIGTTDPDVSLAIVATDAMLIPVGTDAQQPSTPVEGMIRYNSENDYFEGYVDDGSPAWEPINTGAGGKWIDGATVGEIYYDGGNIGVGTITDPSVALDVGGDIEYTGTLTDVSDRRLKDNIKALSQGGSLLDLIDQIDTYSFTMKDDASGRTEFGVMAQELEKVFPELVHTANDEIGTKSVNYVGLIAPMIEATKELKAENEALKAQLAEIKTAQTETNEVLADLGSQVELLNKLAHANTKSEASVQSIIMLLLGLLGGFGIAGVFFIRRRSN